MEKLLKRYPAPLMTRVILIIGLILFLPLYIYLLYRFQMMNIDSTRFTMIWIRFNESGLINFFKEIDQHNLTAQFILTYQLNILSLIGYICTFFSLLLIIARHIPPQSRLYKLAFIFVLIPPVTGILDIIFSIILLAVLTGLTNLSRWIMYCNGINYIIRMILIYITIIWIIAACIYFISRALVKKNSK